MIIYVPFLKAKINEINAVGELSPDVRVAICPFFDYPRKKGLDGTAFKVGVEKAVRSFEKHLGREAEFYIDNFDIDDKLRVGSKHNYRFLLEQFAGFRVIPVVSVDRSSAFIASVHELKLEGTIQSNTVAVRLTSEDFENYEATCDDIADELGAVLGLFEAIDLVFDCRLCADVDPKDRAGEIAEFSRRFCSDYSVRRVIVAGSSIPASVGDVLKVQEERTIARRELKIFSALKPLHKHAPVIFGDYATVSPLYSDVSLAPEILQNVMTAKMTYSHGEFHYFIRGRGLKTNGRQQYFNMANHLCSKGFFRGAAFSSGDEYFDQKGRGVGANCGPNTVIKPSVNSHITYMVCEFLA